MYKSKYIIVDNGAFEAPIVFTELITHSDLARSVGGRVVGAGFCHINDDGHYVCYGESVSCRVKSRGEQDSQILNKYLGVVYE